MIIMMTVASRAQIAMADSSNLTADLLTENGLGDLNKIPRFSASKTHPIHRRPKHPSKPLVSQKTCKLSPHSFVWLTTKRDQHFLNNWRIKSRSDWNIFLSYQIVYSQQKNMTLRGCENKSVYTYFWQYDHVDAFVTDSTSTAQDRYVTGMLKIST